MTDTHTMTTTAPKKKTPRARMADKTPTYRLLKIVYQLVLVEDNGDSLREIVVEPVMMGASGLDALADTVRAQIVELNEQREAVDT